MADLIIKWAVPVLCGGVYGLCVTKLKKFETSIKANSEGTKALLWDKLHYYYLKLVLNGDGTITQDEFDIVTQTYKSYSALGGNGRGKKMYEEIEKLKISN